MDWDISSLPDKARFGNKKAQLNAECGIQEKNPGALVPGFVSWCFSGGSDLELTADLPGGRDRRPAEPEIRNPKSETNWKKTQKVGKEISSQLANNLDYCSAACSNWSSFLWQLKLPAPAVSGFFRM
jgi:hypothetical protein